MGTRYISFQLEHQSVLINKLLIDYLQSFTCGLCICSPVYDIAVYVFLLLLTDTVFQSRITRARTIAFDLLK